MTRSLCDNVIDCSMAPLLWLLTDSVLLRQVLSCQNLEEQKAMGHPWESCNGPQKYSNAGEFDADLKEIIRTERCVGCSNWPVKDSLNYSYQNINTNTGVEILPYTLKPIPIHFRTKRMSWPFWLYIELFIRWNYIHISIVCTYTIDWVINQVWPADCKRAHPEDYQVPGTSMKVAVALKCTRMQVGLTPTFK